MDNPRFEIAIPQDESKIDPKNPFPTPGILVWNNTEPVQQTGGPNWTNNRFDKRDDIKWMWKRDEQGWYKHGGGDSEVSGRGPEPQ